MPKIVPPPPQPPPKPKETPITPKSFPPVRAAPAPSNSTAAGSQIWKRQIADAEEHANRLARELELTKQKLAKEVAEKTTVQVRLDKSHLSFEKSVREAVDRAKSEIEQRCAKEIAAVREWHDRHVREEIIELKELYDKWYHTKETKLVNDAYQRGYRSALETARPPIPLLPSKRSDQDEARRHRRE